jgi:hypothetical protein
VPLLPGACSARLPPSGPPKDNGDASRSAKTDRTVCGGAIVGHGVSELRSGLRHTLGIMFNDDKSGRRFEVLRPGAAILRGYALDQEPAIVDALHSILETSPFRRMVTPGGHTMSVITTNCGAAGWISDVCGYRYAPLDPLSGAPWPSMPLVFLELAVNAAAAAGYDGFAPDACLINRYEPSARLTLHRTGMSVTAVRQSCRCHSGCRPSFSSADCDAQTGHCARS